MVLQRDSDRVGLTETGLDRATTPHAVTQVMESGEATGLQTMSRASSPLVATPGRRGTCGAVASLGLVQDCGM